MYSATVELRPTAEDGQTASSEWYQEKLRVSNRSAGMISSRFPGDIFTKNSAEFAVLSTFAGQGH